MLNFQSLAKAFYEATSAFRCGEIKFQALYLTDQPNGASMESESLENESR